MKSKKKLREVMGRKVNTGSEMKLTYMATFCVLYLFATVDEQFFFLGSGILIAALLEQILEG